MYLLPPAKTALTFKVFICLDKIIHPVPEPEHACHRFRATPFRNRVVSKSGSSLFYNIFLLSSTFIPPLTSKTRWPRAFQSPLKLLPNHFFPGRLTAQRVTTRPSCSLSTQTPASEVRETTTFFTLEFLYKFTIKFPLITYAGPL